MGWVNCLMIFLRKCCGKKIETDSFLNDPLSSFQSTYTVRRISSFGQTVVDENGEENEIGRHSSILTYDGETIPWTSKPAPVQPGVSHSDIINQIKKLPTIKESPRKIKSKYKFKKAELVNKKDTFPKFGNDESCNQDLLLHPLKRSEKAKTLMESSSQSQDDMFSKCQKKNKGKPPITSTLEVPKITTKSISSPDLVNCDMAVQPEIMKVQKDNLSALQVQNISQHYSNSVLNKKSNETERIAKLYGLDLSLYTETALNPLNNASKAITLNKTMIWTEEPAGTLDISLNFNYLQKLLTVTVHAIHSLCGEGTHKEPFASIIKLTLLSRKKIVKSSKQIMASLNPKVDQVFSFLIKDIDSRAIRLSVYNAEWQGKYDAVGHSLYPIQDNLHSVDNLLLKLYSHSSLEKSIGMLQISFGYDGNVFGITVDKLFNFDPKIRKYKLYTKILYYSLSKKVKEKTSPLTWAESGGEEINFNYSASIKIDTSGKNHSYIVISIKSNEDHTMFKHDKTLGRVFLGPYFYSESGNYTPWGRAIINKENMSYSFRLNI